MPGLVLFVSCFLPVPFWLGFLVPTVWAWGGFAANICRGPEIAITGPGPVTTFGGSSSPDARCLGCLCDFRCYFPTFVDYYDGNFRFPFCLIVQWEESDDISFGHFVTEQSQRSFLVLSPPLNCLSMGIRLASLRSRGRFHLRHYCVSEPGCSLELGGNSPLFFPVSFPG